jgi:hypothetical protein
MPTHPETDKKVTKIARHCQIQIELELLRTKTERGRFAGVRAEQVLG